MIMMASPTAPSAMEAAGLNVNDLRQILKIEIEASNELQMKIDQFRYKLLGGKRPPEKNISLMEAANKDMTKDLVRRIERIESQIDLTTTDREMLQALSARLAVCDEQAMRLAELRDSEREMRNGQVLRSPPPPPPPPPPILVRPKPVEVLPLGGRPRRPSTSPSPKVTTHLRPNSISDARSTSPGPILEKPDKKNSSPCGSRERERRRDSLYLYRQSPQSSQSSSTVIGTPPSPLPSRTQPTPKISEETRRQDEPVEEMPYRRPSVTQSSPKVVEPVAEMQQRRLSQAPPSPIFQSSFFTSPRSSAENFSPPPPRSNSDHDLPSTRRASSYCPTSFRQASDNKPPDPIDDKATWPLLYRILDVDPNTSPTIFENVSKMALARLSLKHDPARHPTDPEAPVRWAAVVQAYDTLIDEERRRAYDAHWRERGGDGGEEGEEGGFDFGRLGGRER